MGPMIKTTLELDEEVWKDIRRIALETDTSARALVEEVLKEFLAKKRKVLSSTRS